MPTAQQARDYRTKQNRLAAKTIDERLIQTVVHRFYERARADPVTGPVFERQVEDWPAHLSKMCDFWSSGILRTGRYRGRPTLAHQRVGGIRTEHFNRWLELFAQTVHELCDPQQADVFMDLAGRMGLAMTKMLNLDPPAEGSVAAAQPEFSE